MCGYGRFVEISSITMNKFPNRTVQSTIPIQKIDYVSFESFQSHGHSNQVAVDFLKELVKSNDSVANCYLWGPRGSGKSHLLFSACKTVAQSIYIPVKDLQLPPDSLDGLERYRLVCIDDIHTVACQHDWEKRLFFLLENIKASGNLLIISGNCPASELDFETKDLVNRLAGAQVLKLSSSNDQLKAAILMDRASRIGFRIDQSIVDFVMRRYSRDMHSLVRLLDYIAEQSLEAHRKVTIPFLREIDVLSDSN